MNIALNLPQYRFANLLTRCLCFVSQAAKTRTVSAGHQREEVCDMDHRSTITISKPKGMQVQCLSGSVWITQDNDTRDTMLAAGECFVMATDNRALVHALENAQISVANTRK